MNTEEALRLFAGSAVVAGVVLGHWVNPWFYLFAGFIGFGLFQSAFTKWCPAMVVLGKLGIGSGSCCRK
jgi:hypothetical protein